MEKIVFLGGERGLRIAGNAGGLEKCERKDSYGTDA